MSVTIRRSGTIVVDTVAIAKAAATAAIGQIISRMEDGIGLNDTKMRGYSLGYLAELRRRKEDLRADHRRTGLMLSQIKVMSFENFANAAGDVVRVKVTIGVGSAKDRNLIASYNQLLRPWFGVSRNDAKAINKTVTQVRNALKRKATTTMRRL